LAETKTRNALMVKSILDTATELFDQRGYTETRMQDIASAKAQKNSSLTMRSGWLSRGISVACPR
jgi:hypothetical protein